MPAPHRRLIMFLGIAELSVAKHTLPARPAVNRMLARSRPAAPTVVDTGLARQQPDP